MSTRSSISVRIGDKIKTVYCHFDGYPSHNGKILLDNYNSQELAEAIICLGDLSYLGESLECPTNHKYKTPLDGYSIFYYRDRGDEIADCEASVYSSIEQAMIKEAQEYNYLWNGEKWLVNGFDILEFMKNREIYE